MLIFQSFRVYHRQTVSNPDLAFPRALADFSQRWGG